ncbi:MAG: exo-alpha-sialidase [Bacteroidales bacterium]|nr:exo-alpha-sialidase [Bacteroidales bacterium]
MKKLTSLLVLAAALLPLSLLAQSTDYPTVTLWESPAKPTINTAPSHRIPAIVRCGDGSLLAVCDYRYNLSDVGVNGSQIELQYRRSEDGGKTWSAAKTVCPKVSTRSNWKYAMGDASLVADRESGEVLMMCAAGSTGMGASTASNPIKVGQFRSSDNGRTWDDGQDVTSAIYGLYSGNATALFITSGSLCQSRYVKVDKYYRIYAAFPLRTSRNGNTSGVIYSDDFGRTWHVLGGPTTFPTNTVYEEAKVTEMPDGSVVIMVRDDAGKSNLNAGKKNFNIFTYTDSEKGEGFWSKAVSGITGMKNACNNSILTLPARRVSDGKNVYVSVVALPFHTNDTRDAVNNYGRKSVGFYFKEIASIDDYKEGSNLAAGWQRGLQVTDKLSAYTDLVLLENGNVGLLAEDNGKQGLGADGNAETEAYDIIFRDIPLSTLTGGLYETDLTYGERESFMDGNILARTGGVAGTAVGMIDADAYDYAPKTQQGMEAIVKASREGALQTVMLDQSTPYRVRSVNTSFTDENGKTSTYDLRLWGADETLGILAPVDNDAACLSTVFGFLPASTADGHEILALNAGRHGRYVGATPSAVNTSVPLFEQTDAAVMPPTYAVTSAADGRSTFVCNAPGMASFPAIHLDNHSRLVAWKAESDNSHFYIEPVNEWTIPMQKMEGLEGSYALVNLPFTCAGLPENTEAYAVEYLHGRVADAAIYDDDCRPFAVTYPLLLVNRDGDETITLQGLAHSLYVTHLFPHNILSGTLQSGFTADAGNVVYGLGVQDGLLSLVPIEGGVVPANTAYLTLPKAEAREFYYLNLDGTIDAVSAEKLTRTSSAIYDLQGRRVRSAQRDACQSKNGQSSMFNVQWPTGVYIRNGKKIIR